MSTSAHGQMAGPDTRKLCERTWHVFGRTHYERLAGISNGHLYNLRHGTGDQRQRGHIGKTRLRRRTLAKRDRSEPSSQPDYLQVNSVYQGDLDGIKSLYHLNVVDAVTKYQFVGCLSRVSEAFLPGASGRPDQRLSCG